MTGMGLILAAAGIVSIVMLTLLAMKSPEFFRRLSLILLVAGGLVLALLALFRAIESIGLLAGASSGRETSSSIWPTVQILDWLALVYLCLAIYLSMLVSLPQNGRSSINRGASSD